MKREHRRSPCPVACTLDLIGDRWTLLVIRDLMIGESHFREFLQSPEQIATNILSERLERLVRAELVETYPSAEAAGRNAYRLTSKGKTLLPVLGAVAKWGLDHIQGTEAGMAPVN